MHNAVASNKIDGIHPLVVLDFQPQEHAFSRRLMIRVICNGGRIGVHHAGGLLANERIFNVFGR